MSYEFKTDPFSHQQRIFDETREMKTHALFWEQGCCKTKPTIDIAANLYEEDEIDAVLVVAPPGVERNWLTDELPAHLPDRVTDKSSMMLWQTKRNKTKWHATRFNALVKQEGLVWLFISYNAFMTESGKKAVWRFLRRRRVFYVLDESDDIRTPAAKRTKSVVASGRWASYKRILTGTPVDKPFDIYSQLRFLDEGIWRRRGMKNFAAFKQHYGVWFTRAEAEAELGYDPGYDKLLEYKNLDELKQIMASVGDRLLKEDVLDLPRQLYTKIYFDMTPRQQGFYNKLRDELEIELDSGRIVDGNMTLTWLLRLQQITCGYLVTDADEPIEMCDKTNPRLDATVAWAERFNHQVILWARFRHDVDQLMDALGDDACRYDGALDDDECERSKLAFNAGEFKYFVGTPSKGSRGITMNVAKATGYYSNSFQARLRWQSEARNHRGGQTGVDHGKHGFGILYGDTVAVGTVDTKIISNLRGKFDIATELNGDRLREWI